jgi:hypothetical protein
MAGALALPVLVVARARLGTINHTLLMVEAIERDRLRLGAVVLSQRGDDAPAAARQQPRRASATLAREGAYSWIRALGPGLPRASCWELKQFWRAKVMFHVERVPEQAGPASVDPVAAPRVGWLARAEKQPLT